MARPLIPSWTREHAPSIAVALSLVSHVIAGGVLALVEPERRPATSVLVDFSASSVLVLREDASPDAPADSTPALPIETPAPEAPAQQPPIEAPAPQPADRPEPLPEPEPIPEPEPAPQPKPQPEAIPVEPVAAPIEAVPEPVVLPEPRGEEQPTPVPETPAPQPPQPRAEGQGKEMIQRAPQAQAAPVLPTPQEETPVASFAGVQGTPARRVVYLIDGSGAMAQALRYVRAELVRSVGRLRRDQAFQVIVFRQPVGETGMSIAYFASSGGSPIMVQATGDVKQALVGWLDQVSPSGRSDPLAGIDAAMRLQPDLVFVLAKGIQRSVGFDAQARNDEVLRALDGLNPIVSNGRRAVQIKTIQFLEDDPTGLMQAIAQTHGADARAYRLVTRKELREETAIADPSLPQAR